MTTVSEYYTATTPIALATIASKQFEMEHHSYKNEYG